MSLIISPSLDPTKEPSLGNPGTSGFVLSSTTGSVRSWIKSSGGLSVTSVITANYTADDSEMVRIDSSGGIFTVTLPTSPVDGSMVSIADVTGDCGTNPVLIYGTTKSVMD